MPKIPSFQFYPRDWLSDANLRRCSPLARSVWMDMLCIMWECEKRGVMTTDGEAWTDNEIAESIPGDTYKNHLALQELLRNKVAKRNELGAVFSKRMVEDERIRQQWKDRQTRHRVTQDVTPMSRPSSSSSSKHKSYGASRLSSKDLQAKAEAQVGSLREISPEQHQENLRIIEELSR